MKLKKRTSSRYSFRGFLLRVISTALLLSCTGIAVNSPPQETFATRFITACSLYNSDKSEKSLEALKEIIRMNPENLPATEKLVAFYLELKQEKAAEQYFSALPEETPDPRILYASTYARGLLAAREGNSEKAVACFENAIKMDESIYNPYIALADLFLRHEADGQVTENLYFTDLEKVAGVEGRLNITLARAYLALKRYDLDHSSSLFKEVIEKNGESAAAAFAYHQTSIIYFEKRMVKESIVALEVARRLYKQNDNLPGELATQSNMAIGYYYTQDVAKSVSLLEETLTIYQNLGDKINEAHTLNTLGVIHADSGEIRQGLAYFDRSLAICRSLDYKPLITDLVRNKANIYEMQFDLINALKAYREAILLYEAQNRPRDMVECLNNMAALYLHTGNLSQCRAYMDKALKTGLNYDLKESLCRARTIEARFFYLNNEIPQATGTLHEVLAMSRKEKFFREELTCLYNLSFLYQKQKDYERSLEYSGFLLDLSVDKNLPYITSGALWLRGDTYRAIGDLKQASEIFEKALAISKKNSVEEVIIKAIHGLGQVYLAQGNYPLAIRNFSESISDIESIRHGLLLESFKIGFFENYIDVYENIVSALYGMYAQSGDPTFLARAFAYSEKARARAFADILTQGPLYIKHNIDPVLLEDWENVNLNITKINNRLQELYMTREEKIDGAGAAETEINFLKQQRKNLEGEIDDLSIQFAEQNPAYKEAFFACSPLRSAGNIRDIREDYLDDSTLFLEYMVTPSETYVWSISKDSVSMHALPITSLQLEAKVRRLLNLVKNKLDIRLFPGLSAELYDILVKPVLKDVTGIKKILIAGNHVLNHLPFELLLSHGDMNSGTLLQDNFSVSYIPSAAVLQILRKNYKGRNKEHSILALGYPLNKNFNETPASTLALRLSREEPYLAPLPSLPGTLKEINAITSFFDKKTVLLREEATEKELKLPGRLLDFNYIHLATHCYVNEVQPRYSCLVLTPDDTDDGCLTIDEISSLKMNCELVVLSACETGIGKQLRGEGLLSIARAFFYAGSSGVIASLWPIDDEATSLFMAKFYENLFSGYTKSEALRLTGIWLRSNFTQYAHPYYWAGFILMGMD